MPRDNSLTHREQRLQFGGDLDELFEDDYVYHFTDPQPDAPTPTPQPDPPTPQPDTPTCPATTPDIRKRKATTVPASKKGLVGAQKLEHRERNREHAKRSRLRKNFLLENLQKKINGLQEENSKLKMIITTELPSKAAKLLEEEDAMVASDFKSAPMPSGFGPVKTLIVPDFRLMRALSGSQQNFVITDPSLSDNPITYVSHGFLALTGYKMDEVLGRNCRFLRGPGTSQATVNVIRDAITKGEDCGACLLNYKADGTSFWNQLFIAALRNTDDVIVNYVGVQCEVSKVNVESQQGIVTVPI